MMHCRSFPQVVLFAACLQPMVAAGEESSGGHFTGLVEVSEVLLDVLVTDRQGRVVLGLDEDDFAIVDGGEPVSLSGVAFYSNRVLLREAPEGRVQHPREVVADRHFVFFFHDQRPLAAQLDVLYRQQLAAAHESRRWVREEMLPGDWVAVVSWDYKLKVHQDFTQDRQALFEALGEAARGRDPGETWPSRLSDGAQPSLLRHLPRAKELRRQTPRMEDALRLVAEATSTVPGRKNILLFTIGFGRIDDGEPAARPDLRYYEPMRRALNDNNVAVYPIDLRPPEFRTLQGLFLSRLAADTGGRFYENAGSYLGPLRAIASENNGYYLLSYEARHPPGETGYREVDIRVRDPELRIRARRGYRFGAEAREEPLGGATSSLRPAEEPR